MNSDDKPQNQEYFPESNNQYETLVPVVLVRKRRHIIEPALFGLFIAVGIFETVLQNAIELQYCSSVLNIPQSQCLRNTTDETNERIQRFTSVFLTIRSLIEVGIPCILSFFTGPWSDLYGRKPLLLSSLTGYFITYALWTWGSSITSMPPHYFILFSIPYAFSGGFTLLILSSFCYICDITTIEQRSSRLGVLQATLFFGGFVGTRLSSKLANIGYPITFAISTFVIYLSLMYSYFCVDDSIVLSQIERTSVSRNPFKLSYIKDLFDSCYRKQSARNRLTIAILMLVLTSSMIQYSGEGGIMYLFMQWKLHSVMEDYTSLLSFSILVNAIGAFGGTWLFSKILKCDDLYVLSVAAFFRILAALTIVFGWNMWHLYLSKLLAGTMGLTGPLVRAFLSRIIEPDELGKIFSLIASTESSTPMFAALLYNITYNLTINSYPTAVFLLSAFLGLIMLFSLTLLVELYIHPPSVKKNSISQPTTSINE